MQPERVGTPEDWLRHARSDLVIARQEPSGDLLPGTIAFHAQQAAEKSLKAVLLARGIVFPFKHDLAHLITLLEEASPGFPTDLRAVAGLSAYATIARYPGNSEEVTAESCGRALGLAVAVYEWAASEVPLPG